jgi:uncharacterized protein YbjT (DUF2867 family)
MAARKRAALDRIGCLSAHHRVVDVDAVRDDGAGSLAAFAAPAEAERAVLAAGFASALLRRGIDITDINRGRGSDMVHILEASST